VLRPGGRLFHYVGRPDSGYGARTGAGVGRRLREAGFVEVVERPAAFGLVAERPRRR
jgi:predicted methyltransferase